MKEKSRKPSVAESAPSSIVVFPEHTSAAIKLEKLYLLRDKRLFSERMSSRMVKCAAVLGEGEHLGWQMSVSENGKASIFLFGSKAICESDLEWIAEKTGKSAQISAVGRASIMPEELYELLLPTRKKEDSRAGIGFGGDVGQPSAGDFDAWPDQLTLQFGELVQALRMTGAVLRVTMGPASEAEQALCRKQTLRTYDVSNVNVRDYIGHPIRMRVFVRLPSNPSVRLRTVVDEAIPGAKLQCLGNTRSAEVAMLWDNPVAAAPILPDYAARILMMEPELRRPVIGVETCEEKTEKIPASHRNTKSKKAVVIGKAVDTSGVKRSMTIGETDLKRHYQIVGQTGTGKSTLLVGLILSAIRQGHGLTFFDPHGSTIDVILRSLPKAYADRVRVVRIGDSDNPVPLNIWDSDDPKKEERNISDLCELFSDIFDPLREGCVGPRYERWLSTFAKASIAFLGRRASLESIAVISQNKDNMLKVSRAIQARYPELFETIKNEYGLDKSYDFNATLNWYLCKFQRLTSVEQLRRTLGAGTNALDFARTIDTDTVTLIDLASPAIGTHAARIIGTLLLMKLWNAAMARKERDRTHLVVIDEASLFQTNPMPRMLAESRKFGISMVLCHQHTGQLTQEIRDALEANSANFSAFRLSPRDAAAAAVRLNDPEMQAQLPRLDAFRAITTLSVDGKQTAPFTLEIDRPHKQRDGERTASEIEAHSIETLVAPYRELRALTPSEIQELLEHPDKLTCLKQRRTEPPEKPASLDPRWLEEWTKRRSELKRAI